jgi:hypothetical protein
MPAQNTVTHRGVIYNVETRVATVDGVDRPFTEQEETGLPSWAELQELVNEREQTVAELELQSTPLLKAEAEAWSALVNVNPLDPPTAQLLGA